MAVQLNKISFQAPKMKQLTLIMLCGLLAATFTVAQESADPAAAQTAAEEPANTADADAGDVEADEIDDSDLDLQTYEEDDDDFVPTEEIPADEPIPFPTNI